MHPVTKNNLAIYVFSYNRAKFLANCLTSLEECACPFGIEVTLVDDHSDDKTTIACIKRFENRLRLLSPPQSQSREHKTGGLHSNMRLAFNDAQSRGKQYVLCIQDDMQMARKIQERDLKSATTFFEQNPNSAQLYTCFLKNYFKERDQQLMKLDSSKEAYLRPLNYPGFTSYSDVGLFSLDRYYGLFGTLREGEHENNDFARSNGIQMGFLRNPFMMWLPYPVSMRAGRRSLTLQFVESIAGCGFYPYELMNDIEIDELFSKPDHELPIAEKWLRAPLLKNTSTWSFAGGLSNLLARGGLRGGVGKGLYYLKHKKWGP